MAGTAVSALRYGIRLHLSRALLLVLSGLAGHVAVAAESVRFSGWQFELPDGLAISERSADKIVLRSLPGAGGKVTISFFAPQAIQGKPSDWFGLQRKNWASRYKIVHEETNREAALIDGTSGLRYSANTGDGSGFLQIDAYPVKSGMQLMVVESQGEQGLLAFFNLMPSIRLAGVASDSVADNGPVTVQSSDDLPEPDVQPPPPLGPDPYDSIDWKENGVTIRTTADLDEIDVKDALDTFYSNNKILLGGIPFRPTTFSNAMDIVRKIVAKSFRPEHLTELRQYPDFQDPGKLMDSVAAAMMKGRADEALARLMIAYERWPRDPSVLFNTAALLSQSGYTNESQAILDTMNQTGLRPTIGFGVQPQSALDYMQGYNFARMGQFVQAETLISRVANSDPGLAEAQLMEALLQLRKGKKPITFYINGYYRRQDGYMNTKYPDDPGTKEPPQPHPNSDNSNKPNPGSESGDDDNLDDSVALSAVKYVDMSKGRPGKLPNVYQPTSIESAKMFQDWYLSQMPVMKAELEAHENLRQQLRKRWGRKIPAGPRLDFYNEILRIFDDANARLPQIQKLLRIRNRSIEDLTEAEGRYNDWFMQGLLKIVERHAADDDPTKACPEIRALVSKTHDGLRVYVQHVDYTTRRTHRLWHQYATALGTLVGDPDFRRYLTHEINYANDAEYWGLIANMSHDVRYVTYAVDNICLGDNPNREPDKEQIEESKLASCDDQAGAENSLSMGPLSVSVVCDGVKLSMDVDLGPVELSGEMTVDETGKTTEQKSGGKVNGPGFQLSGSRSRDSSGKETNTVGVEGGIPGLKGRMEVSTDNQGSTSIYAGGKAGDTIKGAGVELGASQESGIEVTVTNGEVSDVALKSSTSVSAKVGSVGGNVTQQHTMSLMPGPRASSGSLPIFKG